MLGRVTYQGFAQAWPAMEDPFGFAEDLKGSREGDILVGGSATLVCALTDLGLVDEYRLMIFPLILGSGKRLFDGAKRTKLQLADITRIGADGVSIHTLTTA